MKQKEVSALPFSLVTKGRVGLRVIVRVEVRKEVFVIPESPGTVTVLHQEVARVTTEETCLLGFQILDGIGVLGPGVGKPAVDGS